MGYFKEIAIEREDIALRIEQEIYKGFDTVDEMKEVFLEIAQDFNVSSDLVWEVYNEADYDFGELVDVGDLYDI